MNPLNVLRKLFHSRRERALERTIKGMEAVIDAMLNPKSLHLDYDQEKEQILVGLSATFVPLFVGWMAEWFTESGGMNYVEMHVFHLDTGPLVFTMQRCEGKTPHELRQEAEARVEQLQQAVDGLRRELDLTYQSPAGAGEEDRV